MSLRVALKRSQYVCKECRINIVSNKRRRYGTNSVTSNPPESDIYDVVTVGGGPVGLAILAALKSSPATSHLKTLLVESQPLAPQKQWQLPDDKYSNRASSITPTNQQFLEAIGALRHLDLSRVQPYDEMQVWDGGNDNSIQFDWGYGSGAGVSEKRQTVATMVENANLSRALLRRIEELSGEGSLISGVKVDGIGNGLDDANGLDLSSWPVLTLKSAEPEEGQEVSTRQIATRLLIGADGINSPVRTFAGINTNGWDYNRHGVVATLKLEPSDDFTFDSGNTTGANDDLNAVLEDFLSDDSDSPHGSQSQPTNKTASNRATAYQRFLPHPHLGGPIAILPLPNNHASLVWSTTPKTAAYLKSLSPASFTALVNGALRLSMTDINYLLSIPLSADQIKITVTEQNTWQSELTWRLQHTKTPSLNKPPPTVTGVQQGSIASFPLRLRNATSYASPRLALAGDAAHTIHPLAGQGLNLGLGDAESLSRHLVEAVRRGQDLGDMQVLSGYSAERYLKGVEMGSGVDLLNGIYQVGGQGGLVGSVLGALRGWGMGVVDKVTWVKEGIMRRAG